MTSKITTRLPVPKTGKDICVNLRSRRTIKTAVKTLTWFKQNQPSKRTSSVCKMMSTLATTCTKSSLDSLSTVLARNNQLLTFKIRTTKVDRALRQISVKLIQMILSRTLQKHYNTMFKKLSHMEQPKRWPPLPNRPLKMSVCSPVRYLVRRECETLIRFKRKLTRSPFSKRKRMTKVSFWRVLHLNKI